MPYKLTLIPRAVQAVGSPQRPVAMAVRHMYSYLSHQSELYYDVFDTKYCGVSPWVQYISVVTQIRAERDLRV